MEPIVNRLDERTLWHEFDSDLPHIFGGLLRGLAEALRGYDHVHLDRLPRMADFATFAAAGIGALGYTAEDFLTAYKNNQESGMSSGIEASPVGCAIQDFMASRETWTGTAEGLLRELAAVSAADVSSQSWPHTPRGLAGALKRLSPALRMQGLDVEMSRTARARKITLTNRPKRSSSPSSTSPGLSWILLSQRRRGTESATNRARRLETGKQLVDCNSRFRSDAS